MNRLILFPILLGALAYVPGVLAANLYVDANPVICDDERTIESNDESHPWCSLQALDNRGSDLNDHTVLMKSGLYVHYHPAGEFDDIRIEANDLTITTASGNRDVLIKAGRWDDTNSSAGMFVLQGDRITIENLEIVGNLIFPDSSTTTPGLYMSTIFRFAGTANNPIIDDLTFRNMHIRDYIPAFDNLNWGHPADSEKLRGNAISGYDTNGLLVEDSIFRATLIDPTGCSEGQINCATTVDKIAGDDIKLRPQYDAQGNPTFNHTNSTVRGCTFGDVGHYNVQGVNLVENNRSHNRLHGGLSGADGSTVRGNVITGVNLYPSETVNAAAAIHMHLKSDARVYNNIIAEGGYYSAGITVFNSGNKVFNNVIHDQGGRGINLTAPMEATTHDNLIKNNLIFGVRETVVNPRYTNSPDPGELTVRCYSGTANCYDSFKIDTTQQNLFQNNMLLPSDQPGATWDLETIHWNQAGGVEFTFEPEEFDLDVALPGVAQNNFGFDQPLEATDLFEWTVNPDGTRSFRLLPTIARYGGIPNPALHAGYCDPSASEEMTDLAGNPRDEHCDVGPYECGGDANSDGVCDATADTDGDGVVDSADNCIAVANPDQTDVDSDGFGNLCDWDVDNDCDVDTADLWATEAADGTTGSSVFDIDESLLVDGAAGGADFNAVGTHITQLPGPSGQVPAGCDPNDLDRDGIDDSVDNCRDHANPSQMDVDGDGFGNMCDWDFDNDCVIDGIDIAAAFAADGTLGYTVFDVDESLLVDVSDGNATGMHYGLLPGPSALVPAGCDPDDLDRDGVDDSVDNCLGVPNPSQMDVDGDGHGNICDADVNNDCVVDVVDLLATVAADGTIGLSIYDIDQSLVVEGGYDEADFNLVGRKISQPIQVGPSAQGLCQ